MSLLKNFCCWNISDGGHSRGEKEERRGSVVFHGTRAISNKRAAPTSVELTVLEDLLASLYREIGHQALRARIYNIACSIAAARSFYSSSGGVLEVVAGGGRG